MQCLGVGGLGGGRGVWPRGVPPTGSRHRWKVSWWSPISPFLILPPLSTLPLPAPPVQYVSLLIFNEVNMDINIVIGISMQTQETHYFVVLNVFGHWLISGVPVFSPLSPLSTAARPVCVSVCFCVCVFLCLCVYVSVCLCLLPFCVNFRCSCVLALLLSLSTAATACLVILSILIAQPAASILGVYQPDFVFYTKCHASTIWW